MVRVPPHGSPRCIPCSWRLWVTAACVVVVAVPGRGAEGSAGPPAESPARPAAVSSPSPALGSVALFANALGAAIEARVESEGLTGALRLELMWSRGIDGEKAEKIFLPRLRRRLKDGGKVQVAADGAVRCRVTLSEDSGRVWAVAVLDGRELLTPSTVAASWPVDRELETALGAVVRASTTRFSVERVGPGPRNVLDAALADLDGDGADELVVVTSEGVATVALTSGGRSERAQLVARFPERRRFPRVVTGWIVAARGGAWAVTSAGNSMFVDLGTRTVLQGPSDLVPLRGTLSIGGQGASLLCGGFRLGSPGFAAPLVNIALFGKSASPLRAPFASRLRDVVTWPAVKDVWVVVDEGGALSTVRASASDRDLQPPVSLAAERVGDRIAVLDVDGDGEHELLTTSASGPGEPDQLVVRHIDATLTSSSVVFRSPLSGGTVVAIATGRGEDGRALAILVEDVGTETLLWRMKRGQ